MERSPMDFVGQLEFLRDRFHYLRDASGYSMRRIAQDIDLHEQTLYGFLAGGDARYSTIVKIAQWCAIYERFLLWKTQAHEMAQARDGGRA